MSDIKLTADELESVKHIIENSPSHFWLRVQDRCQFEVGDILIKMVSSWYDDDDNKKSYKPEQVSDKSRCNRKYKCVYVDELGVPYVKVIKVNGQLGDQLICTAQNDPCYGYWAADPDYTEHLILAEDGQEFDPRAAFNITKKHRGEVTKYNKSIRAKAKSLKDADAVVRAVKAGDKLWVVWKGNDSEAYDAEYTVTSKYTKTAGKIVDDSYGSDVKDMFGAFNKNETFQFLRLKNKDGNTEEVYAGSIFFGERYVYLKRPRSYEVGK